MVVKFISNAKKQGTGATGCKITCHKANSTTTPTITNACTKYVYRKTSTHMAKSWSDCKEKCSEEKKCKSFMYKEKKKVSISRKKRSISKLVEGLFACMPP